jgi:hypothetical protein
MTVVPSDYNEGWLSDANGRALPSKREALSSNPSTIKNKTKQNKKLKEPEDYNGAEKFLLPSDEVAF